MSTFVNIVYVNICQHRVVRARRQAYELELRRRHVPNVMLSDGTEPEAQQGITSAALAGTAASAGTVTGVARVVLDPVGARLEPGEREGRQQARRQNAGPRFRGV